ncbi:MAG: M16 family metallopeptidase [Bacillota bacterium]
MIKNKKRFMILFMLLFIIFSSVLVQGMSLDHQSIFIPHEMEVLPNGMRVIVKEIPDYPVAAVNIWVGAGGRHDPRGKSGLAHYFEHMLFKGTEERSKNEISREIESAGGNLNAMTGLEYTSYYIVVPSDNVSIAMDVQSDAVRNSQFPENEMNYERDVIEQEIKDRDSSPRTALLDASIQNLFAGTPYERPVIGDEDDLSDIKREDMIDFYEKYYVPNNMTLVVVGDVEAEDIFAKARKYYGDMEGSSVPSQEQVTIPELQEVEEIKKERDVEQSYLFMAFPGPRMGQPDAVALETAGIILGQGRASRLYSLLRDEKELVTSISSGYQSYADMGLFWIMAELPPENRDQVEDILRKEIEKMAEGEISEKELERAQSMVRSSFAFDAESNLDIALTMGQMETQASIKSAVNMVKTIESISEKEIKDAVSNYLDPDAYIYGQLDPEGEGGKDNEE